jgi:hypothetical protein
MPIPAERAKRSGPAQRLRPAARAVLLLVSLPALARADDHWHPGIGDPGLAGWIIVIAYLIAAALCARNGQAATHRRRAGVFWGGLAALLVLLGLNKQLDLQTLFTELAKQLVSGLGWYDERRTLQIAFVVALWMGGMTFAVALRRSVAASWREYRLACIGVILLLIFVLLRATRFHLVNWMLELHEEFAVANEILELGAIACIAAGALRWRATRARTLTP